MYNFFRNRFKKYFKIFNIELDEIKFNLFSLILHYCICYIRMQYISRFHFYYLSYCSILTVIIFGLAVILSICTEFSISDREKRDLSDLLVIYHIFFLAIFHFA